MGPASRLEYLIVPTHTVKTEFDVTQYAAKLRGTRYYHTFIDKKSLAAGILCLDPGDKDVQEPHDTDEVYYVIKGDGFLRVGKKDRPVSAGMAFFVPKEMVHYFHRNTSRLEVLYFFGGGI